MKDKKLEIATFAGGCFWCTASSFEKLDGVLDVVSGYTGGEVDHPTYEQVTSGTTGHYEAVQVTFDPEIIPFRELLKIFLTQIDPTDASGSFVDRGSQYRSAVFYHTIEQKLTIEKLIMQINGAKIFNQPVATRILESKKFYEAEPYHQDYHKKNPIQYRFYRAGSGRDVFIDTFWQNKVQIFDTDICSEDNP
ncbi:MAG: peptide-methionine (S)-S-oxide reductase MsrA [Proteobacteria bacterium]|nr:peptide-methionine (S)-S-oxide reductase MsrA [Pseudomonadota bacterium]MBU1586003.1 peptide-methionine (S)-S-oxide reductase MsrA [Pseudomonadota bacterium]MBU2454063.1 peptide-methionine (S)-S-oxide reductase MsrA [Pseudomonadota bacterium]MBU2630084.1 peptide-methionine (S)-S-oxide reductase MsrA [Pseudomonadota bacterium]